MSGSLQIPLSFRPRRNDSLEDFIVGQNKVAVAALEQFLEHSSAGVAKAIYLKGDSGSGKTLLLNAFANKARELGLTAMYLPLKHLLAKSSSPPDEIAGIDVVCIDDIEAVAANSEWEVAIFHLLNQIRSSGGRVVLAGRQGPEHSGIVLPDLQSRLAWGEVYGLKILTDIDKKTVLQKYARTHGVELADEVVHYLLRHGRRDMKYLIATTEALQQAAFASKRAATIPLLRTIMERNNQNNKEYEYAK